MRKQCGVTLIELLVTLSIGVILLAVAAPSVQDFLVQNRVESGSNQLMASLAYARSEAIKRGARITLCKSSNASTCGGTGWEDGWIMFLDSNNNGTRQTSGVTPAESLLRVVQAQTGGITIRGNNNFVNYISYLSGGASNNIGAFAICHNSTLAGSKAIIINSTGRPRLARDTNSNQIPNKDDGNDLSSCTGP